MGLKISLDSINGDEAPFIAIGKDVKVIHMESGIDISDVVQKIDICLRKDDWVTAIIKCDVAKLELSGVDISEIKL